MKITSAGKWLIFLLGVYFATAVCAKADLINITLNEGGGLLPLKFPDGTDVHLAAANQGTVVICEFGANLFGNDCRGNPPLNAYSDSVVFINIVGASFYQFCSDKDEGSEGNDDCPVANLTGTKFIGEDDGSPVYPPGSTEPGFVGSELHPVVQYTLVSEPILAPEAPEPSSALLVSITVGLIFLALRRNSTAGPF
jgi:hypothetical protein